MSIMHLALNPNLTEEEFLNLVKLKQEKNQRLKDCFWENYNKCKDDKIKSQYISSAMPFLIMAMF